MTYQHSIWVQRGRRNSYATGSSFRFASFGMTYQHGIWVQRGRRNSYATGSSFRFASFGMTVEQLFLGVWGGFAAPYSLPSKMKCHSERSEESFKHMNMLGLHK